MENLHEDTIFFWTGPFSQWAPGTIQLEGQTFNTAEQAMMYFKAILFDDHAVAAQILAAADPSKQKALGRKVAGFSETTWAANRVDIVRRINHAKFSQNKGLRRKLLQTRGKILAEVSPLDTIWGIGLDADTAKATPANAWPRQNLLGQILTELRESLAADFTEEARAVQRDTP